MDLQRAPVVAEEVEIPTEANSEKYTVSLKDVERNRKRLKRTIPRNGFLGYILSDFWQIRRFGLASGLFYPRLLIMFSFRQSVLERFEKILIQDIAIPLSARLDIILDKAWMHVDKFDYNHISLLRTLCEEVIGIRFVRADKREQYLYDAIRRLEPFLLVFYRNSDNIRRLLDILSHLHNTMESVNFSQRETRVLVERLLVPGAMTPSLGQLVLAANMLQTRHFLRLSDLCEENDEPVISDQFHDVDEHRLGRIQAYLGEIDANLANVYAGYAVMYAMRFFLPRLDANTPDITVLQRFITEDNGPGRKSRYNEMYSNIPSFAIDFATVYMKNYAGLLCRGVDVENEGHVDIFSPSVFSGYFKQLHANMDQLERIRTQVPYFQISRYLDLTRKERRISSYTEEPNKAEEQVLVLLDDQIRILSGLKTELFERLRFLADSSGESGGIDERRDLRGLPLGNAEVVRLAKRSITAGKQFSGKTVGEALQDSLVLLNLYLYELHEDGVLSDLEEEKRLRTNIQNLLNMVERIGSVDHARRLQRKYPLEQ